MTESDTRPLTYFYSVATCPICGQAVRIARGVIYPRNGGIPIVALRAHFAQLDGWRLCAGSKARVPLSEVSQREGTQ